jgi:hypothetical protein
MEKKQTAVEWLSEHLCNEMNFDYWKAVEKAKQIEKEQMIEFSYKVLNKSNDSITGYVDEEKIYNETYGGTQC